MKTQHRKSGEVLLERRDGHGTVERAAVGLQREVEAGGRDVRSAGPAGDLVSADGSRGDGYDGGVSGDRCDPGRGDLQESVPLQQAGDEVLPLDDAR